MKPEGEDFEKDYDQVLYLLLLGVTLNKPFSG
jgi:hypothetical protein